MSKEKFRRLVLSKFKFKLFLLTKLPSGWFWGTKITKLENHKSEVTIPYTWFSKNPFKSTYFAAQLGAAELSTGVLILYHLSEVAPVSTLVLNIEAKFVKKATEKLTFTCEDGAELALLIVKVISQTEGETITMKSIGRLENGDVACEALITWSLRRRK